MRIRLKYEDQRSSISVSSDNADDAQLTIGHVLNAVSAHLNIARDETNVSLNDDAYFGHDSEDMSMDEWGVVPGDLVYVKTNAQLQSMDEQMNDQIPPSSSGTSNRIDSSIVVDPMPQTLSVTCHDMMNDFNPRSPLHCIALVVYTLLLDEPAIQMSGDQASIEDTLSADGSIIRLYADYICDWNDEQVDGITITLLTHGHFVSACGQVVFHNGDVCSFSCAVPVYNFVFYDQGSQRYEIHDETRLAILIRDDLLLKLRQEIHAYYHLPPVGIQRLPVELQVRLMSFLDARSLCRMERTCTLYRDLSRQGGLWEQLCAREFPKQYRILQDSAENNAMRNWKLAYRQAYEEKKQMDVQRRRHTYSISSSPSRISWNDQPNNNLLQPPGMIGGPLDLQARIHYHW